MKKATIPSFHLAPMAELTTPCLRSIIRSFSSDVVLYSEMLSAGAVVRGGHFNESRQITLATDDPFIFQIIGCEPNTMGAACAVLSQERCSGIDINMGCSAPDILARGWGSKLLTDISLTKNIIRQCRKHTTGTLSVKIRSGFDKHDTDFLKSFTSMLQDEGVDYLTLHGRFAKQAFKRRADWELVRMLKNHLNIPVVGNGDISTAQEAAAYITEGYCEAVMIGREAVKSPWIFKSCSGSGDSTFTVDIENIFLEMLTLIEEYLPLELHKSRAHRFAAYYSGNVMFGHDLMSSIRQCDSLSAMGECFSAYLSRNPHERIITVPC
jgi:tRNA-dihydrouridine synthase B